VSKRSQDKIEVTPSRRRPWFRSLGTTAALVAASMVGCSNGEVIGGKPGTGSDGGGAFEAGSSGAGSSGGDAQSQDEGGSDDEETTVGTTGQRCTSDSDCTSADNDTCSTDYGAMAAGVTGQALPQPVCLQNPTSDNCDPAPPSDSHGLLPHFCDGPDDPTSPGFCLADNPDDPASGMGTCMPKCTFSITGSAAVGCIAPDTCTAWIYAPEGNTVVGYGFCQGTCQKDSDCPPQSGTPATCQVDVGICTTQPVARMLTLGEACTYDDYQSGACNCDVDPDTLTGFCTTACVVGGTPCPAGWVCDASVLSSVVIGTSTIPLTTQNPGLAGICLPSCPLAEATTAAAVVVEGGADDAEANGGSAIDAQSLDATTADALAPAIDAASAPDAGSGGSFQCPAGSTCTLTTVAGPDCVP
jgi:hypothetical protein